MGAVDHPRASPGAAERRIPARGRILVVSHTDEDARIRLISARKATPRERRFYEEESH